MLLYQVICLMNTPPETLEEQQRCLCTTSGCWRLPESNPRTSRWRPAGRAANRVG